MNILRYSRAIWHILIFIFIIVIVRYLKLVFRAPVVILYCIAIANLLKAVNEGVLNFVNYYSYQIIEMVTYIIVVLIVSPFLFSTILYSVTIIKVGSLPKIFSGAYFSNTIGGMWGKIYTTVIIFSVPPLNI